MGFFDGYQSDEGGLDYIGSEEKAKIIKDGLPLTFLRGWYSKSGGFEGKPCYKVVVEFDGKERGLSFPVNPEEKSSRDQLIEDMQAYVDIDEDARPEDWALPVITITMAGKFQLLVPYEA
jgi:hypothetical protein